MTVPSPSASTPASRPLPWPSALPSTWPTTVGVLTDIDDTLTRDGAIEPAALQALQRLHDAGLPVFAITGRPMGWSRAFAAAWPVQAIVAENGAVALHRKPTGTAPSVHAKLQMLFVQDEATRRVNQARLQSVLAHLKQAVPQAQAASDSAGRVTDIAIDHSEHHHLDEAAIDQVVAIMQAAGMTATVSSIHINGWFGAHNKWSGAQWIVREMLGRDLAQEVDQWIYVGDSTNDQLMFKHMPRTSVGVKNLLRFADDLRDWPTYLTEGERGQGVAQVVATVLAARRMRPGANTNQA